MQSDVLDDLPPGWLNVHTLLSGAVGLPLAYAQWLGDTGLINQFDHHWLRARKDGRNRDALAPFAQAHDAPANVIASIPVD